MPSTRVSIVTFTIAALAVAGCQTQSVDMQASDLSLSADMLAKRDAQSRRFDTGDPSKILTACVGLYQDLGFQVDDGSAELGYLVGSKRRDATQAQDVAVQLLLVALAASAKVHYDPHWDTDQRIRLSTTARTARDGRTTVVRVTFQRVLRDNYGHISGMETLDDPDLYQRFFDRLSQSVFLTANAI